MKYFLVIAMCLVECVTNCTDLFAYIKAEEFGSFPSIDALETIGERATYNASVRNFDVERYEKVLGKGNFNMNLPAEVLEAQCRQVQQARQEQTALRVLIAIGIFLGLIIVVSSCSHKVTFVAVENSEILEGNENLE